MKWNRSACNIKRIKDNYKKIELFARIVTKKRNVEKLVLCGNS